MMEHIDFYLCMRSKSSGMFLFYFIKKITNRLKRVPGDPATRRTGFEVGTKLA